MTSEVLILNKKAVVIGADSAVTSSTGAGPLRYAKSGHKIFELAKCGSVAVAVYGSASIDGVPWEVAIKLFQAQLGSRTFGGVDDYANALLAFLSANDQLFPRAQRDLQLSAQFDAAVQEVIWSAAESDPRILDVGLPLKHRQAAWSAQVQHMRRLQCTVSMSESLSEAARDHLLQDLTPWANRVCVELERTPARKAIDAFELAELGHRLRYACPEVLMRCSGLVVTGYGEHQIYPAYAQFQVFGHIGEELCHNKLESFEIGDSQVSMIRPFAKTAAIDMFTSGFDVALERAIDFQSRRCFAAMLEQLKARGIPVPEDICSEVALSCQHVFMSRWKAHCRTHHLTPLLEVLQSMGTREMAQLAECLIEMESLKERVTTSTETVGGPIDVAAITKDDGFVWIHRKP